MAPTATDTSSSSFKRRRFEEENKQGQDHDDPYAIYDDPEYDSKRYVPVKQRKMQELERISSKSALTAAKSAALSATASPKDFASHGAKKPGTSDAEEEGAEEKEAAPTRSKRALLDEARELREKEKYEDKSEAQKLAEEERQILEAHAARKKLASASELAKGVMYTEPLKTSWRPPRFIRERSEAENERLREENHILCDGDDIPPPITNFRVSSIVSLLLPCLSADTSFTIRI